MPDKEEMDPELPLQATARCRLNEAEVIRDNHQTPHVMINGQEVPQHMPPGTLGYDL